VLKSNPRPRHCTAAYQKEKSQKWEATSNREEKTLWNFPYSNITRAWDVLEQDSATSPDSKVKTSKNKSFSQLAATQLKGLAWGCGEGKGFISGLALVGKDIVFRFIIEYSSLRDSGPR
jgi:hypothetical protein